MASHELPPYPQMITEAIDALKQPGGADKSSISDYMESKYSELPSDHADLLTTHLAEMKDNGELFLLNDHYLRPGSTNATPAKRGRGRPPKPKDPLASVPVANPGPPRPRGRPPSKDSNGPSAAKKPKPSVGSTGRPRGRPRKVKPQQTVENGVEA